MGAYRKKSEFAEFEEELGLFDREYEGFPYWQSIRFQVCKEVYGESYSENVSADGASLHDVLVKVRAALRGVVGYASQGECEVLCVLNSPLARKFYDTWDFPDGVSACYMETCAERTSPRRAVPNTLTFSFVAKARKTAWSWTRRRRDEREFAFLESLSRELERRFGRGVPAERLEDMIVSCRFACREGEKYFRRLFARTRCKALVVVCYYQLPLYPAYEVAKEMGVKVVELQHGVIFDHQSYWFEDRRGVNNHVPDYFLSFGRAHTDGARMLPATEPVAVGFPFQERELARFAGRIPDERRVVVYPAPDAAFDAAVADFAREAIRRGYSVVVKLHPMESRIYEGLYPLTCGVPGVEFAADQSLGIYHWLSSARHHVMANTTVGLEAVCLPGINIYVATFVKHEQLKPLLEGGDASGFGSAGELLDLVERGDAPVRSGLRDALWTRGAKGNVERFFAERHREGWA